MQRIPIEPHITGDAGYNISDQVYYAIFEKDAELRQRGQASDLIGYKAHREFIPEEILDAVYAPAKGGCTSCVECGQELLDWKPFLNWAWQQAVPLGAVDAFGYGRKQGEQIKLIGEAK